MQGTSTEINGGTSLKYRLYKDAYSEQAFQIGAWVRAANWLDSGMHLDAFIVSARVDLNDFSLGLSYDMNLSGLRTTSRTNGAIEVALVYKVAGKDNRIHCPVF